MDNINSLVGLSKTLATWKRPKFQAVQKSSNRCKKPESFPEGGGGGGGGEEPNRIVL